MSLPARHLAPAKINLCLHVTGQRPDGYHMLDSLVVFTGAGDVVEAEPARTLSLTLSGPFALDLGSDIDNLVLKAAELIRPDRAGAALHLVKSLPIASGIGGGSSDAAAALRALSALWDVPLPSPGQVAALGADVPVCLDPKPCRMRGIGDVLSPLADPLPPFWMVLANPGVHVPTPPIFQALKTKHNPGLPEALPQCDGLAELVAWLHAETRNDLQAPACEMAPVISDVLKVLEETKDCALARMSGSGATCFGLYESEFAALEASAQLRDAHPSWWVTATDVLT